MSERIYHICTRGAWEAAESAGSYEGSDDDLRDGFIHFSSGDQVVESAARHRAGQTGLVLVTVDSGKLGSELRWEESRGGDTFPHLYGPLPLEAVEKVQDLVLGPGGKHLFPELD